LGEELGQDARSYSLWRSQWRGSEVLRVLRVLRVVDWLFGVLEVGVGVVVLGCGGAGLTRVGDGRRCRGVGGDRGDSGSGGSGWPQRSPEVGGGLGHLLEERGVVLGDGGADASGEEGDLGAVALGVEGGVRLEGVGEEGGGAVSEATCGVEDEGHEAVLGESQVAESGVVLGPLVPLHEVGGCVGGDGVDVALGVSAAGRIDDRGVDEEDGEVGHLETDVEADAGAGTVGVGG